MSADLTKAPQEDAELEEMLDLSLEEMLEVEVTSASLKTQRLMDVPSAVHVISSEDILRSGATSIPEMLRMVPGLHVGQIDANKWAVSSRGFAGRFSRQLLVLINGRSIYNNSFAGVYWDAQDLIAEDIERIEIIRGPGSTIWGSNAMNGVINIITKSAAHTKGGLAKVGMGSERPKNGAFRYGGALNDAFDYRLYAKGFELDSSHDTDTQDDAYDHMQSGRMGFRLDGQLNPRDQLMAEGEISRSTNHTSYLATGALNDLISQTYPKDEEKVTGAHLLARWVRAIDEHESLTIQAYYDRYHRNSQVALKETSDVFDFELHHLFRWGQHHQIIWGGSTRWIQHEMENTNYMIFTPEKRNMATISLFVQDEIQFHKDWFLTLGSKLEYNSFTQLEVQPNARLLWRMAPEHSLWASVSRALHTPSRLEYDSNVYGDFAASGTVLNYSRKGKMNPEEVYAMELGYRGKVHEEAFLEANLFYNVYNGLIGLGDYTDTIVAPGYLQRSYALGNVTDGNSYGMEFSMEWQAQAWWKLIAGASYVLFDLNHHSSEIERNSLREEQTPQKQFTLRSQMNLPHDLTLDTWFRYVDEIPLSTLTTQHSTVDIRLAWQPRQHLELSLTGKNLLDPRHVEAIDEFTGMTAHEVERSIYAQVKWMF
ncbi:TonB-dependent receptor plug domain-containing protein [Magnetococcus sp. PR-3]|uniref:TonB-dependent receptor plug domain-containing protein n=1 Tax=Magnetococcus sp. PR-3 TaxID=3120355 RepID=UPI002FCE38B2